MPVQAGGEHLGIRIKGRASAMLWGRVCSSEQSSGPMSKPAGEKESPTAYAQLCQDRRVGGPGLKYTQGLWGT